VLKAPRKVTAGKPVTFDGSSSSDPDHDPITYAWRFGDGGTSTAVKPSHAYENPGRYTVRLVVTDEFGAASAAATRTIVVSKPTGCVVPKLHGKSLAAAKRALRKAHCAIGKITHKHSRLVKPGHVIASKPRPHARRRAGSKVALIIAR
jgi:PKD repeat protein